MACYPPARKAAAFVAILVVMGAGLAGWRLHRKKQEAALLFRRLPARHLVLGYVDLQRLRQSPALLPLIRSQVEPEADYSEFVRKTGFDYRNDLDRASVCYLPDRVYILAQGRFNAARLRQYAIESGGSCAGSGLQRPCSMPGSRPGTKVSFVLISDGVLAIATAAEADAVLQLASEPSPTAEPVAQTAAAEGGSAALLWMSAAPASLDQAIHGSPLPPNLALFSRALAQSTRDFLFLADRAGKLEVSLHAVCATEAQAADVRSLLDALNSLMRGFMRQGSNQSNPWQRVVETASFVRQQKKVIATWTIEPSLLETLAKPGDK